METHLPGWMCEECGAYEDNPDVQPVVCDECDGHFCAKCLIEHDCDE